LTASKNATEDWRTGEEERLLDDALFCLEA
jgi:hypothetical protein